MSGRRPIVLVAALASVGAVGITVTRIDRGTEAELAWMNLGDDLTGLLQDGSESRMSLLADSPECDRDETYA